MLGVRNDCLREAGLLRASEKGQSQGGHNLPFPVPCSPASRTFLSLSPDSRLLLCFSCYHVKHAV